MMKIICTIIVIFLAQCVHLQPGIGNFLDKIPIHSCVFGAQSVSIILYDSEKPQGRKIELNESCNAINPYDEIKIVGLVHGFISSANRTLIYELASELVKKNYTVFSVDWSDAACSNDIPLFKPVEYPSAVKNTREIGELMAKFVIHLIKDCEIPLNNITFIGHSLGAHVCGFAAKNIYNEGHGKINRIIGADPAAPGFSLNKCENRLCKTDASHVIVLQTSVLGIKFSLGEVNLQFNNGYNQPGCPLPPFDIACSHSKSIAYVTYALKDGYGFPAVSISDPHVIPDRNKTDCIMVDKRILTGSIPGGDYYVFVNKTAPYVVEKNSFSCQ